MSIQSSLVGMTQNIGTIATAKADREYDKKLKEAKLEGAAKPHVSNNTINNIRGNVEVNAQIGELAMDRVRVQTAAKIAQRTNLVGGNNGSEIT